MTLFFSMKILGDLVHVKNFTERTVFVNTYDTAVELFDGKGAMYNSRPRLVMCNELYVSFLSVPSSTLWLICVLDHRQGWGYMPSLMPYGDRQKKSRQVMHHYFQPSSVGQYNPIILKEVHRMLLSVLKNPEDFTKYIRQCVEIDPLFSWVFYLTIIAIASQEQSSWW